MKKASLNTYFILLYRLMLIMFIMSICRLLFYLFNQSLYVDIKFTHLLYLFWGGLKFDIVAVFYVNILFIILSIIPFKFREINFYQKVLKFIFIVFNSISIAFNCLDIIYYKFTFRRTTYTFFKEFENDKGNINLQLKIFTDYWYLLLIYILLIVLMYKLYSWVTIKKTTQNGFKYYLTAGLFTIIGIGLFIAGVRGGFKYTTRPITLSNAGAYINKPIEQGLVINTPFSIIKTIQRKALKKVNYFSNENELETFFNPIITPNSDSVFKNKNVVIFLLESFSKEYIGYFNKELDNEQYKGYTPFLDSLLDYSLSYKYSFANGTKSIDAMPSVLTSIPHINEPYILSAYSNNYINTLPNLLSQKGYDCSFFHGAPNGSMGFDAFTKMAGFEHYYGKTEYNNDKDFDGLWGIWDEPFFQYFANKLNEKKAPFFATLFSVSSHHPFKVPKEYEGKFDKGTLPIHQCVGYTDMALKHFFEKAKKMPWFNNTIFIITADHSSMAYHKEYKTSAGAFSVPIIFYEPNSNLIGYKNERIHQTDIMPTLLDYLNYDKKYFSFGKNIWDKKNNNSNYINTNYFNNQFQFFDSSYVFIENNEKINAIYNYKNDVFMQNNLINKIDSFKLQVNIKKANAFKQQYINRMIDNKLLAN